MKPKLTIKSHNSQITGILVPVYGFGVTPSVHVNFLRTLFNVTTDQDKVKNTKTQNTRQQMNFWE